MNSALNRPVCEIGETTYTWGDVALWAMLTGAWNPLEREIREGLACLATADAGDAGEPEEAIEEFASAFRYRRDLITADEAEAWLEERSIDTDDWTDWTRREGLRQAWADRVAQLVSDFPSTTEEVLAAAPLDLLCGSRGRALAIGLAHRAAVAVESEVEGEAEAPSLPQERIALIASRFPLSNGVELVARLEQLARMDAAYDRWRRTAATPERIARELELGRLEWIRLDCRVIQFESAALAREAYLCVKEDGLSIDAVASDAHAPVYEMRFFLGELDTALRPRLLAAAPRELIGPAELDGRHTLFLVLDKLLPDETTPDTRKELERRAIARAEAEQVVRRVRWLERWPVSDE